MTVRPRHLAITMSAMAYEAMSPFGITWAYLGLLLLPVLLTASLVLAVVRRKEVTSPRLLLLIGAAVAAGLWTFFTVGQSVRVPITGDPQGAECVNNAFGENPNLSVDWGSDCGRAFERHLLISGTPSLLMLAFVVIAASQGVRQKRRNGEPSPVG
jgi:hypothetical protein